MLSQRAQIPCKLVSAAVSVLWGFNKVLRSGMLRVSWQWDSCVVVTVCELCSPSMSDFLEGLESSGWLKHIKAVLDAGIFIAKVSLEANPYCLPHRCPQYWFRCGFVCVLYLLCVCVKPTSSIFAGTIREALEAFPQIYTNEPQPLTDEVVIIFIISLQCTAVPLLSWELHFKNNRWNPQSSQLYSLQLL